MTIDIDISGLTVADLTGNVGRALQQWRLRAGMSVSDVSESLEELGHTIKVSGLKDIEAGRRNPNLADICAFAMLMDEVPLDLIFHSGNMKLMPWFTGFRLGKIYDDFPTPHITPSNRIRYLNDFCKAHAHLVEAEAKVVVSNPSRPQSVNLSNVKSLHEETLSALTSALRRPSLTKDERTSIAELMKAVDSYLAMSRALHSLSFPENVFSLPNAAQVEGLLIALDAVHNIKNG